MSGYGFFYGGNSYFAKLNGTYYEVIRVNCYGIDDYSYWHFQVSRIEGETLRNSIIKFISDTTNNDIGTTYRGPKDEVYSYVNKICA